jgi:hypothetical protein
MSGATGMWGRRSPLVAIWPSGVHQLVPQSAETARHLIQVVTGQDCHCCLVRSLAGLSEVLASERGRPQRGAGLREGQASERRRPQRGAGLREAQASERGRPQRGAGLREGQASERGRPQRGAGLREAQASERGRPQRGAGLREGQASEKYCKATKCTREQRPSTQLHEVGWGSENSLRFGRPLAVAGPL